MENEKIVKERGCGKDIDGRYFETCSHCEYFFGCLECNRFRQRKNYKVFTLVKTITMEEGDTTEGEE